ncbi:MAG: hypothetical protein JO071_01950 [Deltaproteobacteria bacterium]|nr:hypothetical protein [Deltaproteobacteria bacterium]
MIAWFLVLAFGYLLVSHPGPVFAQLPAPNPLVVPPLPPPPPAQLRPIVPPQQGGIPSLAVVPTPAVIATPISAARIFNCSCFGQASPTHWMGRVSAPGYFSAQQTAVNTCLAYNRDKEPQPPVVLSGSQLGAVTGLVANQTAVASALSAGQQLPSTVTFFTPQQLRACSHCTCN